MAISAKIKTVVEGLTLRKILVIALVLRLCWYLFILFTNPSGIWLYDSNGYWNIAYNLKEYGIFSRDAEPPILPDYFRTPLYPLLIFPTLFFDPQGYTIPLIHIAIDCVTCLLVYKIMFTVSGNPNAAKAGALVYALHIPAVIMSNYVLTESIFAFLILLFVWTFIRLVNKLNWKNALLTGLAGGLCVMCKPLGFVLIYPAIGFLLILHKVNFKTVTAILFVCVAFYTVQFPWMQRNKNVYGRYFNSVLGEHLLFGYHASHVYAKANNLNFNRVQEFLRERTYDGIDFNPYKHPYEYAKLIEKKSYGILLEHKMIFATQHVKECMKFFVQPLYSYIIFQTGRKHAYSKPLAIALSIEQIIVYALFYIAIAWALWLNIRKQLSFHWIIYFLLCIILVFSQFNTMPFTDGRMRFAIEPLLVITAVSLAYAHYSKKSKS